MHEDLNQIPKMKNHYLFRYKNAEIERLWTLYSGTYII